MKNIIVGAIILGVIGVIVFGLFSSKGKGVVPKSLASISGTIHFDRLAPDPGDKGELYIQSRAYGSSDPFVDTGVVASLKNDATWNWATAEKGKTYEVIAQLRIDGKPIKDSDSLIVTAPGSAQILTMTITWDDLPEYVVKDQQVSIGGTITLQGYIPEGTMIEIVSREQDTADYVVQWSTLKPLLSNEWVWTTATPKKAYEIKALLKQGGVVIGQSNITKIQGMKTSDVNFQIVSDAKPPVPTTSPQTPIPPQSASIRGSFSINGPLNANSSVLIMWSAPGQNKWNEIARVKNPRNESQSWEWSGAKAGGTYEISMVLQVNEQTNASTQNKVVTAPASDVNFVLNTGVQISAPTNKPALQSCTNNSNNQWDANITVPVNSTYGNYWVQIGSAPGRTENYNNKIRPTSNDDMVRLTIRVNNQQSYSVRYAYSLCTNCTSDASFSNFSDGQTFTCGGPEPTVTIPPMTSRCNESCGGNGYTCVLGLSCVSTDVPGESACRNPNCSDRTNCNCL